MTKEELKQRLIELLIDADIATQEAEITGYQEAMAHIAYYLIANGVTIRERGEWRINCDGYYPYCPKCMREPESGKMTDFCPHCGADMRGGKDE